ncbi:MAG: heat-inducible transcriptional repressor HrcA [Chloroflexia bacterium]
MVRNTGVPELTERRKEILKLVIQEYVRTAQPVPSEVLVQKYGLPVSPATVRNELAALEELGLLTHPHTSAGRVPTDRGYRCFVEQLMEWTPLPSEERRTIRHQFFQVRTQMEEWARLGAATLARLAHTAAIVSPPRAPSCCFKHLELLSVYDTRVLLVIVLQDGTIRQHMLTLNEVIPQEELSRTSNRLNERLAGLSASEIAELPQEGWTPLEREVTELLLATMQQRDRWDWEEVAMDGVLEALSQPEFAEIERARQFLEILEQGYLLLELLNEAMHRSGVQVIIGAESQREQMRDYSLVVSRYGLAGRMEGVLGILGPTRMPYPRSISAVHFVAHVMNDLLGQLPE